MLSLKVIAHLPTAPGVTVNVAADAAADDGDTLAIDAHVSVSANDPAYAASATVTVCAAPLAASESADGDAETPAGAVVGVIVGAVVGAPVGAAVGEAVGALLGAIVGVALGAGVGVVETGGAQPAPATAATNATVRR